MKTKIILMIIVSLICLLCVSPVKAELDFKLGVEYTFAGKEAPDGSTFAKVYADMGAILTKPQDGKVYMEMVQKECGGVFDWSVLDEMVLAYQKHGFDFLVVLATKYDKEPSKYTVEEMKCYQEYVRQTVERYDMDGIDDMHGLLRPINYWQVDSEFGTGFFDKRGPLAELMGTSWDDAGGEYILMLEMANPPIKQANPNAKILTISWQSRGLWTDKDGEQRVFANMSEWDTKDHMGAIQKYMVVLIYLISVVLI